MSAPPPLPGADGRPPTVGIVGHAGAYGRWLARFFRERMGLAVLGSDPAEPGSPPPGELAARCQVLVFSVPIRQAAAIIAATAEAAGGREAGALWLDLTSIKQAPVAAMLASRAEVAGLHPMAAPPAIATLHGRTLAVCRARISRWEPWLARFLQATGARVVAVEPAAHDRAMALVQGLVHASHMAQAEVLAALAAEAGGLALLDALGTVGHALDLTVTGRILAGNPAIYTDIQFDNPHVAAVLERLAQALADLRAQVARGDDGARAALAARFLAAPAAALGRARLARLSHDFDRLGDLQADLRSPRHVSVFLPEDRPGALRRLLAVFERLGVNLASIHSSRTPAGELHFRIGLDPLPLPLEALCAAIAEAGIGRVLEAADDAA